MDVLLSRKGKGDLAELKVACDLVDRGYQIAIPFGEESDFDLIAVRGEKVVRVQVKHATCKNGAIRVECRSKSLTNGKVMRTKRYTAAMIDWLAVYERTTDRCFYLPATELGSGRSTLSLRLVPTRNRQSAGIRLAEDYCSLD